LTTAVAGAAATKRVHDPRSAAEIRLFLQAVEQENEGR
jgi:hypothetical protein